MAAIRCKACGRLYSYKKEGCCPNCGAYNRPPKQERVNADGTVQHMTDAAYEHRQHAQGKVCFEKKECFEDQTRQSKPRIEVKSTAAASPSHNKGRKSPAQSIIGVIIAVMIASGVFSSFFDRLTGVDVEPEDYTGPVYTEPDENEPVEVIIGGDNTAAMMEEVTMEDGSTFTVWDWERNDDSKEMVIYLDVLPAEDSEHYFDAVLRCTYPSGEEELLTEAYTVQDSDGTMEYHFDISGYSDLTPAFFEVHEWEHGDVILTQTIDLR